jgi:hypothetical protein
MDLPGGGAESADVEVMIACLRRWMFGLVLISLLVPVL